MELPSDPRRWWYYPIVMPLKDGLGPASDEECDEITWEVWDQVCNSYGSFKCLPDALKMAIELNKTCVEKVINGEIYLVEEDYASFEEACRVREAVEVGNGYHKNHGRST